MEDSRSLASSPRGLRRHRALETYSVMNSLFAEDKVFVTWRDSRTTNPHCVGDLSADDPGDKSTISFAFTESEDLSELLIYFYLPLNISGASGTRNVYLVIPIEAIDADAADPALSMDVITSTHEHQTVPPLEKARVEAGLNIIRFRFVLKKLGYAIMPLGNADRPTSAQSRGLLLSLKSLSRATYFDIHIQHTPAREERIREMFQKLRRGAYRTPEIDHRTTFSGRNWVTNCWNAYGIRDHEAPSLAWNPSVEECPPPYHEAIGSSCRNSDNPPTLDSAGTVGPLGHPDFASWNIGIEQSSLPDTDDPFPSEVEKEDGPQEEEEKEDGAYRLQEGDERHNGSLADGDGHVSLQKSRDRKRKATEALSDAEVNDGRPPRVGGEPHTSRTRKGKDREESTLSADSSVEAVPAQRDLHPVIVLCKENLVFPKKSIFKSGRNRTHFTQEQYGWFVEVALWLSATWPRQSFIHDAYFAELGMLCQAIRLGDRERFEKVRIDCSTMVARQARSPDPNVAQPFRMPLEERLRCILEFIYRRVGPASDSLITDELSALYGLECFWLEVGGDDGRNTGDYEWTRRKRAYDLQLCACLLMALYRDGGYWYNPDKRSR